MRVSVTNALTGDEIAVLDTQQMPSPTVRDIQRLVKGVIDAPKKALHVVAGAVRLSPHDAIPACSELGVLVSHPICAHCGTAPKRLSTCALCLDACYCGVDCQRKHWRLHRGVCRRFGPRLPL